MPSDPRLTHNLDQLGALLQDVAREIGAYRAALEREGVPPEEAEVLVHRLEERLLGPLLEGEDP